MGPQAEVLRVVLDTNVVVSALVLDRGTMLWFRRAWQQLTFTPLIDEWCARELVRVLSYPKFKLDEEEVCGLLSDYLPYAEVVAIKRHRHSNLPVCRDPDDRMFLMLAHHGNADILVTGDQALLELAGRTKFKIENPGAFRRRFSGA